LPLRGSHRATPMWFWGFRFSIDSAWCEFKHFTLLFICQPFFQNNLKSFFAAVDTSGGLLLLEGNLIINTLDEVINEMVEILQIIYKSIS